jgi:UDP-GlcNAc:undecaprenyl-phosphate GlcNAc-1-phosphate transferase
MKTFPNLIVLYVAAVIVAGAVTALATPLVRRLASHVGMLDQTGDRRMHEDPKPRIGGIGVFLGFAFALFTVLGFALAHPKMLYPSVGDNLEASHNLVGLLFGSMLILGVGVWDDIMGMRPRNKFIAQILVAAISMLYGFVIPGIANPFNHDPHTSWITFPMWASIPLTLFWYVAMMNAINFIDGLDGLLSGVAVISCASIFVISVTHGDPVTALIVASLAGAALGFLPYNFNPAKIILGDSGSLFIGYVFATVSMIGASKSAVAIGLLVPVVVLALPILDTFFAIARRALSGKSITEADRGHFHHQLIFRFGMNVRQAVLLIYVVCVAFGVAALIVSGTLHIKL